ncbi:MAG: GNAT family N-acetyltransferase [Actinomycetota bacterium]
MDIELLEATKDDLPTLDNLAQLYQYDFSEFAGGDVDTEGLFGFVGFDSLFDKPVHRAFLIRVDGRIAGFATAYRGEAFRDPSEELWWMDEFFVMKKYRGKGVGEYVAREIFDRLPGTWEVGQISPNTSAQAFWRRVIGRYTDDDYEEIVIDDKRWNGPVQYFTSR